MEKYRDADYDMDKYFDKTTSWPEGLQECQQFEPNLPRPVRRANSVDDIQRYKDHFLIAKRNQGEWFKWKYYLKVLRDDLRHFDTLIIMTKSLLKRLASPQDSEISHYVTASEPEIMEKPLPTYKIVKKQSLVQIENAGDTDSVHSIGAVSINSVSSVAGVSINSTILLSPSKNLLKKFCAEIRHLASKTYKTVEKISMKSKYCSACGDYIGNMKNHKECSLNLIDNKKHVPAPSVLKSTNLSRKVSESLNSVSSCGSGEFNAKSYFTEQFLLNRKKGFPKRMLPFVNEKY